MPEERPREWLFRFFISILSISTVEGSIAIEPVVRVFHVVLSARDGRKGLVGQAP